MRELMKKSTSLLLDNQPFVMVSIIAESGSSPRGAGAKMIVEKNGNIHGTIGGGAIEFKAMEIADGLFETKQAREEEFVLTKNQVADLGMICGGKVTVYFQYIDSTEKNKALFNAALASFEKNEQSILLTYIATGTTPKMAVISESDGKLSTHEAQFDVEIIKEEKLMSSQTLLIVEEDYKVYIEPLNQLGIVYLFGGGHVSQALAPVLESIGFSYAVYDDMQKFSNETLFPNALKHYVAPFTSVRDTISITKDDYVIIMTRGHKNDFDVIVEALKTDAYYIGVIGSSKKIAATHQRLKDECGFNDDDLKRLITPIGLAIKADTPAEIAISIAAELILHRAEK